MVAYSDIAALSLRPNEQESVRRPKLQRVVDYLALGPVGRLNQANAWTGDQTIAGALSASGALRMGAYTTPISYRPTTVAATAENQIVTSGADSSGLAKRTFVVAFGAATPRLSFAYSSNPSPGAHTPTADNALIGDLEWFASDGTDFRRAAAIRGLIGSGTVNTSGFEGRILFSLGAPGTGVLTPYMDLTPNGVAVNGQVRPGSYASGAYPASLGAGSIIYSTTLSVPLYSDGTNWRRFDTNAIVT